MQAVQVNRGSSPLILSFPHGGTYVPPDIFNNLNANGQLLADADWHIARLYENLITDITTVHATFHRYVIDANRDPTGKSLYPGQNTTDLIALTDFDGKAIWNKEPDEADLQKNLQRFHKPYHQALEAEITRLKAKHGYVILYDCHSIRSTIPFLFSGSLPSFNIGTNDNSTAHIKIEEAIENIVKRATAYNYIFNGRFKGGWTTRHYGDPSNKIYAIQMELAQKEYLTDETPPFAYDSNKAERLRVYLKEIMGALSKLNLK